MYRLRKLLDLISRVSGMGYRLRGLDVDRSQPGPVTGNGKQQIGFLQVRYLSPDTVKDALAVIMNENDIILQAETGLVVLQGTETILRDAEEILVRLDQPGEVVIDTRDKSLLDILFEVSEELQLDLIADPSLASQRVAINRLHADPWELVAKLESIADLRIILMRYSRSK